MARNYIDFISSYCDRWCERCAFTDRCSAYAAEAAIAMCGGDVRAGLELAFGRPATPAAGPAPAPDLDDVPNEAPSDAEMAAFEREEEARDARIDESPITTMATMIMMLTRDWLERHRERLTASADSTVRDPIDTVGWDAYFIPAKLHRALRGRDERQRGESDGDDHAVQNDWNGSAKVALISIERSHHAWCTIAAATGDPDAARLVDELSRLRAAVEEAFPSARRFVRPGFDDGGRRRRWNWF